MSLNRRLYQWLLNVTSEGTPMALSRSSSVGSEEGILDEEATTVESYFDIYSKHIVIAAVIVLFREEEHEKGKIFENTMRASYTKKSGSLKPFRILISLLDKPEISSVILEEVLLEVFRALHKKCNVVSSSRQAEYVGANSKEKSGSRDELIKQANLLFNAFHPSFMWEFIGKLLTACKHDLKTSGPEAEQDDVDNQKPTNKALEKLKQTGIVVELPTCDEIFMLIDFLLDVVFLVS